MSPRCWLAVGLAHAMGAGRRPRAAAAPQPQKFESKESQEASRGYSVRLSHTLPIAYRLPTRPANARTNFRVQSTTCTGTLADRPLDIFLFNFVFGDFLLSFFFPEMSPFGGVSSTWAALAVLMIGPSVIRSADGFVPSSLLQQRPSSRASAISTVVLSSTSAGELEGATSGALGATSKKSVASAPKIAQRWRKSTKQLATLGPASSDRETIEKLFLAGADVFRLNFSHGSQEQKKELLDTIRSVEEQYSHPIAALGDLQGPKLRVRKSLATGLRI